MKIDWQYKNQKKCVRTQKYLEFNKKVIFYVCKKQGKANVSEHIDTICFLNLFQNKKILSL